MRRTFGDIKLSRIPAALNLCSTDTKFRDIMNEAQERLVPLGTWWGEFAKYRCSTTGGLLVWPAEVASILSVALTNEPIKNRDMFFEFIETSDGILDATTGGLMMVDRGNTPVFQQMTGVVSTVIVYNDLAVDNNTAVTLCGYDDHGNWIRTLQGGVYADGEVVLSSGAGTHSTNIFSVITSVRKARTSGPIRLYAYDTVALTQSLVSVMQYWETNPWYRTSQIPDICDTETATVDCIVKLELIPVVEDTDYMLIACIPALKDMGQAIIAAENETDMAKKAQAISAGIVLAKASLEAEFTHYQGAVQSLVPTEGVGGPLNEIIEAFV